jgi:hypothetical protein
MTRKIDYNKWHSGPPPSVGWWPASAFCFGGVYRWWDGKRWSNPAGSDSAPEEAGWTAARPSPLPLYEIQWRHRPADWPERSRT